MPERRLLRSIPSNTSLDVVRGRVVQRRDPLQQRFVPDAVETDWRRYVATRQVVRKTPTLQRQSREIIVLRRDIEMGQTVEVHPDEKNLVIVLQFSGIVIEGGFIPGKNNYGEGNTVFYAPVNFWKKGKEVQASLIIATWGEKKIIESQVARKINENPFFRPQVSLTHLANYDSELNGVHPNIDDYNLGGMKISGNSNTVIVTYPEQNLF